jgi:hypothetical protein
MFAHPDPAPIPRFLQKSALNPGTLLYRGYDKLSVERVSVQTDATPKTPHAILANLPQEAYFKGPFIIILRENVLFYDIIIPTNCICQ